MNRLKRFIKWSRTPHGSHKLVTLAIVVAWVVLFIVAMSLRAEAHDTHLSDIQIGVCHIDAGPSWVLGLGAVVHSSCFDAEHGWWLLYKGGDLTHSGVHVIPLTEEQVDNVLEVNSESD